MFRSLRGMIYIASVMMLPFSIVAPLYKDLEKVFFYLPTLMTILTLSLVWMPILHLVDRFVRKKINGPIRLVLQKNHIEVSRMKENLDQLIADANFLARVEVIEANIYDSHLAPGETVDELIASQTSRLNLISRQKEEQRENSIRVFGLFEHYNPFFRNDHSLDELVAKHPTRLGLKFLQALRESITAELLLCKNVIQDDEHYTFNESVERAQQLLENVQNNLIKTFEKALIETMSNL